MNTEKVIVGIIAGLAAGAILGILFAPNSGEETRRKISQKGTDSLADIKCKLNDLMNEFSGKMEETKEAAKDIYEKEKAHAQEVKNDVKNAMS